MMSADPSDEDAQDTRGAQRSHFGQDEHNQILNHPQAASLEMAIGVDHKATRENSKRNEEMAQALLGQYATRIPGWRYS